MTQPFDEFDISQEALARLKKAQGDSFQKIFGYSNATMEKFYKAAYGLFSQEKYSEAADAFFFLTTLNPRIHVYWLGLGMSEELQEEYEKAVGAYSMAALTNPSNPLSHYHSATCYRKLQDKQAAIAALELAIHFAEDRQEFRALKEHALQQLNLIDL